MRDSPPEAQRSSRAGAAPQQRAPGMTAAGAPAKIPVTVRTAVAALRDMRRAC